MDKKNFHKNKPLGAWIGRTSKMMGFYIKERFRESGIDLTREQWVVLMRLDETDGLMQTELALITERDKTSLTRLLTTMANKNLVVRIPSPEDKRINRIFITRHGRKVFDSTIPIFKKFLKVTQKGITSKELEIARSVLEKIQKNISQ